MVIITSYTACQSLSLTACQSLSLTACPSLSLTACQSLYLTACPLQGLADMKDKLKVLSVPTTTALVHNLSSIHGKKDEERGCVCACVREREGDRESVCVSIDEKDPER
jgi:hypothetical protein